jgi:hypothetical protein
MDEHTAQIHLGPDETILLSENGVLYLFTLVGDQDWRMSRPGFSWHRMDRRKESGTDGRLFLTGERLLFVAQVGVFRRKLKVVYTLSVERITDIQAFRDESVLQIAGDSEPEQIVQFLLESPEWWLQAIESLL